MNGAAAELAGQAVTVIMEADGLAATLAAAFDAFEVIRVIARASDQSTPWGLPAFMTAADAAVEGREAVTAAPSLPPGPAAPPVLRAVTADGAEPARSAISYLAIVLSGGLGRARADAGEPADRDACAAAAAAADRISRIMTGNGDGCLW